MSSFRPRIAIVGRFAASTSALRFAAVVNARALLESVWAAGGDPVTLLPVEGADWTERLVGYDGVLLPGGGDGEVDLVRPAAGDVAELGPVDGGDVGEGGLGCHPPAADEVSRVDRHSGHGHVS